MNRLGDAIIEGRGDTGTGVQTVVAADEVTYTAGGASFGGDEGASAKAPTEKAGGGEDVAAKSSSVVEASSADEK